MVKRNPPGTYKGLFATWIDYRSVVFGESGADTLRHINSHLGTRHKSGWISVLSTGQRSTPDQVLELITTDLPHMLIWCHQRVGLPPLSEAKAFALTALLQPPIKKN